MPHEGHLALAKQGGQREGSYYNPPASAWYTCTTKGLCALVGHAIDSRALFVAALALLGLALLALKTGLELPGAGARTTIGRRASLWAMLLTLALLCALSKSIEDVLNPPVMDDEQIDADNPLCGQVSLGTRCNTVRFAHRFTYAPILPTSR